MFASDDVVFAWAIGKALLIVIFSIGTLVYVAWAATYQKRNATRIGISKNSALRYKLPSKQARFCSLQTGQLKNRKGHARIPARTSAEEIRAFASRLAARRGRLAFVEITRETVVIDKPPLH